MAAALRLVVAPPALMLALLPMPEISPTVIAVPDRVTLPKFLAAWELTDVLLPALSE